MSLTIKARLTPVAKEVCRQLRRNSTKAEDIFWGQVRDRRFLGLKFYRQHPLFVDADGRDTFFVADFYCHEKLLVVELDGRVHENEKDRDRVRQRLIEAKNMRVKRFRNEQVEGNIKRVMKELEGFIKSITK